MGNITQLHQGSLNGLRRQTNECIDAAYNKGYQDGAKKQDEVQYQNGYIKGYEDGKKCLSDSELERIWENKLDQAKADGYDNGYDTGYNNALKDVNHAMDVLEDMTVAEVKEWFGDCEEIGDVVCEFTIQRIIDTVKAYEEKKKAEEEIKVGDIVKYNEKCHNYDHVKSREYLVLHIFDNGLVSLLFDNGDTGATEISLLDKTGRHFDEVEQLLDKLKGEDNDNN